jgi:integrase
MAMGRPRKTNQLGLDPKKHARLYTKHGAFYYVHKDNRWERLGTDLAEAKKKAEHYNDVGGNYGTMAYWLDEFILHCEKRVGMSREQRGLARRTYEDYKKDVEQLKQTFGHFLPTQIEPHHIGNYLDVGAMANRPVRANREKACLSAAFTWMIRRPDSFVKMNPCVGVKRNPEFKRERYVEHDEFQAVQKLAVKQVRGLMNLIYRTLQRPEDIITWTPADIIQKREPNGSIRRIIRNDQGKTGKIVDIAITPEIDAILKDLRMDGTSTGPGMTLIHTLSGKPYTYDGLGGMLRRYIVKAMEKKQVRESFGFYDLKGKGATDMWLAGVPLEQIQVLCGHDSITTTEVYVKCRWRGTVEPNKVSISV